MTTPAIDGKMLVIALYHSALVSGLAAGYARLGKMAIGVRLAIAFAMATKDMVFKQGLIPADILKYWRA